MLCGCEFLLPQGGQRASACLPALETPERFSPFFSAASILSNCHGLCAGSRMPACSPGRLHCQLLLNYSTWMCGCVPGLYPGFLSLLVVSGDLIQSRVYHLHAWDLSYPGFKSIPPVVTFPRSRGQHCPHHTLPVVVDISGLKGSLWLLNKG